MLAAGAIGSPQLLQLSGIGPGSLLQSREIEVLHELPGVGENLHDHLQIRLQYRVQGVPTLNERANSLLGKAAMGLEYLLFRSGPLTMPPSQLGAFARSDPSQPTPNIEWHVQPLTLDKFGDPLHRFPAITPSVCNLRPSSRGWVRIRSADPQTPPAIRYNYLATENDRRVMLEGLKFARRLVNAPPLAGYVAGEFQPGERVQSDEEWLAFCREAGDTVFHPTSTCRMGADAASVVDERLRVRGVGALRVIDASVMPSVVSGNTNAAVIALAEKGADLVREDAAL